MLPINRFMLQVIIRNSYQLTVMCHVCIFRLRFSTSLCCCLFFSNLFHFLLPEDRENKLCTLCSKKSDAKIQITITTAHLIRINYPLNTFNHRLSGTNIANFNKIHHMVSEQQLFTKWNLITEFSNMENTN